MVNKLNIDWVYANLGKTVIWRGIQLGRIVGYSCDSEKIVVEARNAQPHFIHDIQIPYDDGTYTWLIKDAGYGFLYNINELTIDGTNRSAKETKQLKLKEIELLEQKIGSSLYSKEMIDKFEERIEELILSGNEQYTPSNL